MRLQGLVLALLVVTLATAGCTTCGPTVSQLHLQSSIDAGFVGNRTAYHDALVAEGFTIDDQYGSWVLVGERDGLRVSLQATYPDDNATDVWLTVDVPQKEFRDDAGGHGRALTYGEREAVRVQPAVDAVLERLSVAAGAPAKDHPALAASISIC